MHRRRLQLARLLKLRLGDRFQMFGRGFQEIGDKREAIDGFRYHLAIENTVDGHYWTEKLADALLGWALPIYCGAPAAQEYFPGGAFIRLDIGDLNAAVEQVVSVLEGDRYQHHLGAIGEARRRVIEQYSLPAVIARVIHTERRPQEMRLDSPATLRPNKEFQPTYAKIDRILHKWLVSKRFYWPIR